MKTFIRSFSTVMLIAVLFSCQKEVSVPTTEVQQTKTKVSRTSSANRVDATATLTGDAGCPPTEVGLIAGQHIDAGKISVRNDDQFIYITYTTANGYLLTQTHLYVGNCAAIPVNKTGNPVPGQFPYKTAQNYVSTFTYQVPVSAIGMGQCGCIAAHAVVVKKDATGNVIDMQTGWGAGSLINTAGGNWGTKFEYCTCYYAAAD